jgi:hypothetical protein
VTVLVGVGVVVAVDVSPLEGVAVLVVGTNVGVGSNVDPSL